MPSPMLTALRLSSMTPTASPLTYSTRSGRRSCAPDSVTSSATAKSLASGFCQSISQIFLGVLACGQFHVHAIAEQAVHCPVVVVEAARGVVRLAVQQVERPADLLSGVSPIRQPVAQQPFVDLAIGPVGPVTHEAVVQLVPEQRDDAVLGGALGLADVAHR